tara:strand:- start:56 stop:217 length:162 start_codon:yes stop_codon:yes gene_type:complete
MVNKKLFYLISLFSEKYNVVRNWAEGDAIIVEIKRQSGRNFFVYRSGRIIKVK